MTTQTEQEGLSLFSMEARAQLRSMALVLVISFLCTAVSAVTWFRNNTSTQLPLAEETYRVQMDFLKDPEGVHGGENQLAGCYKGDFCDTTFTVPKDVTQGVAMIANVGSGKAFHYTLTVSVIEKETQKPIFQAKDVAPVQAGGKAANHIVPLTPGTTVRLQLYTAEEGMTIHTASHVGQLIRPYSDNRHLVYLTKDITVDGDMVFQNGYPNIHLAGHTITAKSLAVQTRQGDFGKMTIGGGRLVLNGQSLTNGATVPVTGDGHVTVSLQNLQP